MIQEKIDQIDLESIASQVKKKGLTVPAICLLEMYKPIAGLGHAALLSIYPLMIPIFGSKASKKLLSFCEDRENIEKFLTHLEQDSSASIG